MPAAVVARGMGVVAWHGVLGVRVCWGVAVRPWEQACGLNSTLHCIIMVIAAGNK